MDFNALTDRTKRTFVEVLLGCLSFGVLACGASKTNSTTAATTSASGAPATSVRTDYRSGQFCSVAKQARYEARGLSCVNGHLTSGAKPTSTTSKKSTTSSTATSRSRTPSNGGVTAPTGTTPANGGVSP